MNEHTRLSNLLMNDKLANFGESWSWINFKMYDSIFYAFNTYITIWSAGFFTQDRHWTCCDTHSTRTERIPFAVTEPGILIYISICAT